MKQPILTHELILEAPERTTDTGGGQDVTWHPIGTLWADIESTSAREPVSGFRESARITHRITIRNAPVSSPRRPSADCRFRSGQRIFAIRGIAHADTKRKYLICWTEEAPFA